MDIEGYELGSRWGKGNKGTWRSVAPSIDSLGSWLEGYHEQA